MKRIPVQLRAISWREAKLPLYIEPFYMATMHRLISTKLDFNMNGLSILKFDDYCLRQYYPGRKFLC